MKSKPLLEDKLVTWKRAYELVLAELTFGDRTQNTRDLRAAAARTAAILIQGVDLGDRSTD